jgi:hypothetical protein
MQALLNLPAPVNTVQSCRNFYDKSETLIRGLESLGQSQESYGALLVPVMMNKLPSKIKENITCEHGLIQWSLVNLRQSLFEEITIMEAGQTITLHSEEPTMSTVYLAKTNTPSNKNVNTWRNSLDICTRKPCIYCEKSHSPIVCSKVNDQKARFEILKQKKIVSTVLVITMFPIVVLKYCVNIVAENTIQVFVVKLRLQLQSRQIRRKMKLKAKVIQIKKT